MQSVIAYSLNYISNISSLIILPKNKSDECQYYLVSLYFLIKMGSIFNREEPPTVEINFGRENNYNKTNFIDTTKYTIITFLPKALILQFLRPANYVYLIAAIAQSIPAISSLNPFTSIGPLIFVLGVALIKEAIQDYKRWMQDRRINYSQTEMLINREFLEIKWKDIQLGDIIKVKQGQMIPVDMILLYSTQENNICFVQTMNLDGESNLKTKHAFVENIKLYPNQFEIIKGKITAEKPNCNLHEFYGIIDIENHQPKPLSLENLLVRGSVIKNTHQAVGVAIYVGHDTKIMKNQGQIKHKVSTVQKKVNRIQFCLLLVLIGLSIWSCIFYAIYHTQFQHGNRTDFFYLPKNNNQSMALQVFLLFFTAFLLHAFLIPISMNVALQGIKVFQGIFINMDKKMYYQPNNQYTSTLNMSIIQELGVIDYVLTDKTGTLTANQMKFRYVWINGTSYNFQNLIDCSTGALLDKSIESKQFTQFWQAVIICHEVVMDPSKQQYQGSSPDEVCFVDFARQIGYTFIKKTKNYIQLNIKGQKIIYQCLYTIPFSPRKRMSVIVKNLQNGQITLFTKGADTAIKAKANAFRYQQNFQQNLVNYSVQGYRTLVFSKKTLSEQEMSAFLRENNHLKTCKFQNTLSLDQIQQRKETLIEQIQSELDIIGISAIQDRLQDGVPQTIARLSQAGIVVMMITGDKLQTAQNIGYLSNFIAKDSKIYQFRSTKQDLTQYIRNTLAEVNQSNIHFSMIIQADSIRNYIENQANESIQLIKKCKSVIFCRSTPKQKALIVQFVRQKIGGIVLAIGDGGNDIGMIQQANIGVGIIGKEGNQAASASDFYFSQFRYLDRLILHHGRWSYLRMSYFFVYYGWKNLTLTIILFCFMTSSVYSGLPGLSSTFIMVYNAFLCSAIIIYYSVLEQDINADTYPPAKDKQPQFYKQFKQLELFSYRRYLLWSCSGVACAIYIYFASWVFMMDTAAVNSSGYPADFITFADTASVSLSIIVICVVLSDMNNFTFVSFWIVFILLTILPMIGFFIGENFANLQNFNVKYGLGDNMNFRYWASVWAIGIIPVLLKVGWNSFWFLFHPTLVDRTMHERQGAQDYKYVATRSYSLINIKQANKTK